MPGNESQITTLPFANFFPDVTALMSHNMSTGRMALPHLGTAGFKAYANIQAMTASEPESLSAAFNVKNAVGAGQALSATSQVMNSALNPSMINFVGREIFHHTFTTALVSGGRFAHGPNRVGYERFVGAMRTHLPSYIDIVLKTSMDGAQGKPVSGLNQALKQMFRDTSFTLQGTTVPGLSERGRQLAYKTSHTAPTANAAKQARKEVARWTKTATNAATKFAVGSVILDAGVFAHVAYETYETLNKPGASREDKASKMVETTGSLMSLTGAVLSTFPSYFCKTAPTIFRAPRTPITMGLTLAVMGTGLALYETTSTGKNKSFGGATQGALTAYDRSVEVTTETVRAVNIQLENMKERAYEFRNRLPSLSLPVDVDDDYFLLCGLDREL